MKDDVRGRGGLVGGETRPTREDVADAGIDAMLDELARREADASVARIDGNLVGECIADRHPALLGRVEIRIAAAAGGSFVDAWLPTLRGVVVRVGDRVLLERPANWPEAIVIGVLDGFEPRPAPVSAPAAAIELRADESVVVLDSRGAPLLELSEGEHGPKVRLARADLELEVPGRLHMRADSIRLTAAGPIEVDAGGDVIVRGETIELN